MAQDTGFLGKCAIGRNGAAMVMMIAHALTASWLSAFVALGGSRSPFLSSFVMILYKIGGFYRVLAAGAVL